MIRIFSVFLFIVFCQNSLQSILSQSVDKKILWNTLKLRWGPDPLISNDEVFVRQPLTTQQALRDQYERLPTSSGDGCMSGPTVGYRYWKGNDTGAIPIFDWKGKISGLQLAFPTSSANARFYDFDRQTMFNREKINGIDMYTLTAYFVKPDTICNVAKHLSQRQSEETGSGLYFQNGTNPLRDLVSVPIWQDQLGSTKWTRGACFKTMGVHYWYDARLNTDCSQFLPAFLLYNKGQLSGFGWDIMGKFNMSRRIEFPPKSAILSFIMPAPTCMQQFYDSVGGFTTQHIYFNTDPENLEC